MCMVQTQKHQKHRTLYFELTTLLNFLHCTVLYCAVLCLTFRILARGHPPSTPIGGGSSKKRGTGGNEAARASWRGNRSTHNRTEADGGKEKSIPFKAQQQGMLALPNLTKRMVHLVRTLVCSRRAYSLGRYRDTYASRRGCNTTCFPLGFWIEPYLWHQQWQKRGWRPQPQGMRARLFGSESS